MAWHITMLFIHAAALIALGTLFRHSPDTIQRAVLVVLLCATAIFLYGDAAALLGLWLHWTVTRLGHHIEHIAVLLYVFRLSVLDQEKQCLPRFSARYHSSPR